MLDAKSLLDMQTWSQPCGGANENFIYANVLHADANANVYAGICDVNVCDVLSNAKILSGYADMNAAIWWCKWKLLVM